MPFTFLRTDGAPVFRVGRDFGIGRGGRTPPRGRTPPLPRGRTEEFDWFELVDCFGIVRLEVVVEGVEGVELFDVVEAGDFEFDFDFLAAFFFLFAAISSIIDIGFLIAGAVSLCFDCFADFKLAPP